MKWQTYILIIIVINIQAQPVTNTYRALNTYGSGEQAAINFYQKHVSNIMSAGCPMYPACSQYAKIYYSQYNYLTATLATADRLLRCGHHPAEYIKIKVEGNVYLYDPAVSETDTIVLDKNKSEDTSKVQNIADHLYNYKYYSAAYQEYMRYVIEEHNSAKSKEYAWYRAIMCLYYMRNYEVFGDMYDTFIKQYPSSNYIIHLRIAQAKILLHDKKYDSALQILEYTKKQSTDSMEVKYLLCYTYLQMGNIKNAQAICNKSVSEIKFMSPVWPAMSSAALPGSGYMMIGQPVTGVVSLLVNGLMAWGMYESWDKGYYAGFGAFAMMGGIWYFGSIRGSYLQCKKRNHKRLMQHFDF
ncbi:MAG: membrane protein insertion efficiency factor YidD [Cytophagales bacterium]|nr:membrane protein insertion efficiency factor YidD [Cytophagales bacterium]